MTKILVIDYVGNGENWINHFLNINKIEIVNVITSKNSNQQRAIIVNSSWDYILIFERNMRSVLNLILNDLQIQSKKIIYPLDPSSWINNPEAVYTLFKPREQNYTDIHRWLDFYMDCRLNNFISCTTEDGLTYVATSRDMAIMKLTYMLRKNFAADDMESFYRLTKRFYNTENNMINKRGGVFS